MKESLPNGSRLSYENKLILGPMVRIGTLPMRLLSLEYGADIVYTEEIIDWKLIRSIRRVNDVLGTVDYVDDSDGTVIFRTCQREKDYLVLQLGTCDAERALEVGKKLENDISGIDINMGCPKKFSICGGMGVALLSEPEKACNILKTLVNGLKIPVTCKIRVFEDFDQTYELCEKLASTGISAIAIHGRTANERPQHPNRNDTIKKISEKLKIPVIANGVSKEIEKYKDFIKIKNECACSSIMISRAAEWNCSIFRSEGLLPMDDVIKDYLKLAIDYDNSPSNTKYCIQNILRELQESELGREFRAAQTLQQITKIWNMDEYCKLKLKEFRDKGFHGRVNALEVTGTKRKLQINDDEDVIIIPCAFLRSNYNDDISLPKTRLIRWTNENRKLKPRYEIISEEKLFRAIVIVDNKKYSSSFWEKNKKWAEQGAALACLCSLRLVDPEELKKDGSLFR